MHPVFKVGPLEFPAYFTMLTIGYVTAVLLAHWDAVRQGLNGDRILDLALILFAAGIVGARAAHVVADEMFDEYVYLCVDPLKTQGLYLPGGARCQSNEDCQRYKRGELCNRQTGTCHQGRDCLRVFKFWYGGLVWYGGLLLGIPVGIWFLRRHRIPVPIVADMAGYAIPLGLSFGRIGCFLAGCCFGKVCPISHGGVVFPRGSAVYEYHLQRHLIDRAATHSLPVIPTQLYESFGCLLIFLFVFFYLRPRRKFSGQSFYFMLMAYASLRFVLEFFRDDPRGGLFGLSTSQLIGIPLFGVALALYVAGLRRQHRVREN